MSMINLKNSLSGEVEPFVPIDPNNVRIYVCGMTVYDYCHIGHARALVVFDVLVRHLRSRFGEGAVTYVRNVTDIDDKIIARAAERGESIGELTARFVDAMHEDAAALGVVPPDHEPRATTHIPQILDMVDRLHERGLAYQGASGDVYYHVPAFAGYGKLSKRSVEEQSAGARIDVASDKRGEHDFVLWKMSKSGEPGWASRWGRGRPGWHIECSAMARELLGDRFDIHGGGLDLKFPHHENEIAQSEGCTGHQHVNYWVHNGFVQVDDEKMSKSLGNFLTIRDVLKSFEGEVLRLFILGSNYQSPLGYSTEALVRARASLETLYRALAVAEPIASSGEGIDDAYRDRFMEALDDNLNTPSALSVLFEIAKEINRTPAENSDRLASLHRTMMELGRGIGLLALEPERFLRGDSGATALSNEEIDRLVEERRCARSERAWARADEIRDLLESHGVELEDGRTETRWRYVA